MPVAASLFFGDPTRASSTVAGVTGTNGKTTTAFLLHAILEAAGRPAGPAHQHRAPRRRRAPPDRPEHARGDRPAAAPARDGRRRRPGGVLEATSEAQAQGRLDGHPLRRPRLHEPDPRPPQLPRDDGGLLRRPRRRSSRRPSGPSSTSATSGGGGSRRRLPDAVTFDAASEALDGIELKLRGAFNRENAIGAALAADALGVERDAIRRGIESVAASPAGSRRSRRASRSP